MLFAAVVVDDGVVVMMVEEVVKLGELKQLRRSPGSKTKKEDRY